MREDFIFYLEFSPDYHERNYAAVYMVWQCAVINDTNLTNGMLMVQLY